MKQSVPVKKLHSAAKLPTYGTSYAAGADLYACLDEPMTVAPGQTVLVPTGLAMEIPEGFAGLVYARSGLATKQGLAPANKVGVIDSDYRGEILICIFNHSDTPRVISHGDRIAQMILTPYLTGLFTEVEALSATDRGVQGFGSTGTK